MGVAGVLRIVAAAALVLALCLYYSHGLSIQIWPDSFGYLTQARGIAGFVPYARPGDRSVGYPALVALALLTPRPALAIVATQALLAIGGLIAVYRTLTRSILPRSGLVPSDRGVWASALLAGTGLAALYSALHVQVAALLTEILFAVLALTAVLAVIWLVRPDRTSRRPWLEAVAVAAVAAVPLLVKPHWLIAAAGLVLVSGVWLWHTTMRSGAPLVVRLLHLGVALVIVAGAVELTTLPDRLLAARYNPRDQALFGPRTVFCNHAHLIRATLQRRPGLVLQDEPLFERRLRERLDDVVARYRSGWRLLGYNGDLCTYNAELSRLLDERFPDFRDEGRFLLGAVAKAALADPLPYARKVVVQSVFGFLTAFDRFAIRARTGIEPSDRSSIAKYPPPSFFAGVQDAAVVGPFDGAEMLKETWPGLIVQAVLAVIFFAAELALVLGVLAALVLPWWCWWTWSSDTRRTFLVFVALPFGVLFAHHLLIALAHTFDVWRYGFNMFFVNLLFMGASVLFWAGEWRRRRAARP
jgi:hypothetical protein